MRAESKFVPNKFLSLKWHVSVYMGHTHQTRDQPFQQLCDVILRAASPFWLLLEAAQPPVLLYASVWPYAIIIYMA